MRGSRLMAVALVAAWGCEAPADDTAPTTRERPNADRMTVYVYFTRGEAPTPLTRQVRVDAQRRPAELALRELLRGPTAEERRQGHTSFFSADTEGMLREVRFAGRRLVVDFGDFRSVIPNASSSAGSEAFLNELNATVFQFPEFLEAEYFIEGSCDTFWNFLQRGCEIVTREWRP